jgi:hypothetical protein
VNGVGRARCGRSTVIVVVRLGQIPGRIGSELLQAAAAAKEIIRALVLMAVFAAAVNFHAADGIEQIRNRRRLSHIIHTNSLVRVFRRRRHRRYRKIRSDGRHCGRRAHRPAYPPIFSVPLEFQHLVDPGSIFPDMVLNYSAHIFTGRFAVVGVLGDLFDFAQRKTEQRSHADETQPVCVPGPEQPIAIILLTRRLYQADSGVISDDMGRCVTLYCEFVHG